MEPIKRTVNNMSLKQKLLFIMLMGVSMIASVSFLSIYILSSTYNRLLYRSMSETMSYSAKEITDYLSKMENLTELFLSDDEVQETLVSLTNAQESGDKAPNLVREAGICVQNYYFNNADGILKYITLYTQASVIRTNLIVAGEVPEEIQQLLRQKAQQKDGAPSWTDEYMNEYGLFLSRTVRKIDGLELAPLGTILLEIDMNQLVKASTNFEQQYGNPMYVIRAKGQELYHTANLSEEAMETIAFETIDQYDIRTIDGSSYFITHGSIPEFGWDYYCLVSYEEVSDKIMNVQWACIGLTIFVFAAIVGLTTNLTGKLLIHISSLKERMKRFAEDNMSVPAPLYDYTDRQDELGILNRQFDEMSRTIISLIRENYVNELLKKEAQVKALENQINPHFLYNTLDSIKWRAKSAEQKVKEVLTWLEEEGNGAGKPFLVTEVGAGGIYAFRDTAHDVWSEELQAEILKKQLSEIFACEDCMGMYIWQFCDVRVSRISWAIRRPKSRNNKGIVDEFRRPKLAYASVKEVFGRYGNYR